MSRGDRVLLNTNVISETRKARADSGVIAFLSAAEPTMLLVSFQNVGEFARELWSSAGLILNAADPLVVWG